MRRVWSTLAVVAVVVGGVGSGHAAQRPRCAGRLATIVGTNKGEVLEGTRRADVIHGLGGFDTIDGLDGDDVVCGGPGGNALQGGAGSDTLVGGGGREVLAGGPGDDVIRGEGEADVLEGAAGSDRLLGGDGLDTVAYFNAEHGVTVDLARGSAWGDGPDVLGGIELVTGSDRGDRLLGDGRGNVLVGLNGDDVVDGRGGKDVVAGGVGDDRFLGGPGRDTVAFADARGVTVDLGDGRATGSGNDTLAGFEVVVASPRDDTLRGGPGPDTFLPGGGDDRVDGRRGADTVSYRDAEDDVRADLGRHRVTNGYEVDRVFDVENVRGSPGGDVLKGDAGRNVLDGGPGWDELVETAAGDVLLGGGPAPDTLDLREVPHGAEVDLRAGTVRARGTDRIRSFEVVFGTEHDDVIRGSAALNRIEGGGGSDSIRGGGGFDTLTGGDGDDTIAAGDFDDEVRGGAGSDVIDAGGGIDRIYDQDGDDRVNAGAGSDIVVAGAGADVLSGGPGVDVLWPYYDYIEPPSPGLVVDFASGAATGSALGTDAISGFEGAVGSRSDDELRGDDGPNFFYAGHGGEDTIAGGGGPDLMFTSGHASHIAGGSGDDYAFTPPGDVDDVDGGEGTDECWYAETQESCERDETSPAPQFDPEFDRVEPSGARAPRGVSAYARDGYIGGSVVTLLPLVACDGGSLGYVERREGGAWRIVARVYINEGGYRSRQLKVEGLYRVRLPSAPDEYGGYARSDNCMAAVSEPVRLTPPG